MRSVTGSAQGPCSRARALRADRDAIVVQLFGLVGFWSVHGTADRVSGRILATDAPSLPWVRRAGGGVRDPRRGGGLTGTREGNCGHRQRIQAGWVNTRTGP